MGQHFKDAKQMDSIKLSILIPTLSSRAEKCLRLVDNILDQIEKENAIGLVEVVTLYDKGEKLIGTKRNELIQMAKGEYIAFVDDDDELSKNYVKNLLDGIEKGVDCCSLKGIITWDGNMPQIFEHSLKYDKWATTANDIMYERPPNHLNCVKKSLIFDVKYDDIAFGEDANWSNRVKDLGLLKTEHYIDEVMYHYLFSTKK